MPTSGYADPEYAVDSYGSGALFFGARGMPRCSCWISFTTNPSAAPVWEDVSQYLRAFAPRRGRTYELDQFSPGTLNVTLDNRDRRFDPDYTGSPYYPNVVPMRRIKITATWGTDYTVFDGYIDGWPQNYDIPHEANVTVSATDAFKVLGLAKMASSTYAYEVLVDAPVHWWRMDEAQGLEALDSGSSPVTGTYGGALNYTVTGNSPFDSDTAMEFVDPSASSTNPGGGYFTAPTTVGQTAGSWSIEFWSRDLPGFGNLLAQPMRDPDIGIDDAFDLWAFRLVSSTNRPSGIAFLYTGSSGAQQVILVTMAAVLGTPGWHHFVATYDGATVVLYVDGVAVGSNPFTGPIYPGGSKIKGPSPAASSFNAGVVVPLDEIATYDHALSAARVKAHYDAAVSGWSGERSDVRISRALDVAGISATARSLEAGNSTMGAAVLNSQGVREHIQEVELAENGVFFFAADGTATFHNRHHPVTSPNNDSQATFGDYKAS